VHRRRLRLDGFDYSTAGAYFVTVCTHHRAPLFAAIAYARCAEHCWHAIPGHYDVDLDAFAVMPDHVHGIVLIGGGGAARPLHAVVGSFKSAVTREINELRNTQGAQVWQRGYFDRIVRDETELEALREYVISNPDVWNSDSTQRRRAETSAVAPWLGS
jgi:REP element-mobilizing transposase RayT